MATKAKEATAQQGFKVVWMTTDHLLSSHDEENPRDHGDDILDGAQSLLRAGWGEVGIVYNELLGKLAGGHGRTLYADWLRQQSEEWFDDQWEKWLATSKDRAEIASEHKQRFSPAFWRQCPVNIVNWDAMTHRAMLIRLNNQAKAGTDSPVRMAALLAQLPKQQVDLAGWEESSRKAFTAAYLNRVEKEPIEEDEPLDFQAGQRFERPDATDYDTDDYDPEDDATVESGAVTSHYEDPESGEQEGEDFTQAKVDVDIDESFRHEDVAYDSSLRQTRAVLLYDRKQLEEFKLLAKPLAFILKKLGYEIDDVGQGIKFWRPDAILTAMQHLVYKQYPQWLAEYEATKTAKLEPEEEDDAA